MRKKNEHVFLRKNLPFFKKIKTPFFEGKKCAQKCSKSERETAQKITNMQNCPKACKNGTKFAMIVRNYEDNVIFKKKKRKNTKVSKLSENTKKTAKMAMKKIEKFRQSRKNEPFGKKMHRK